MDNINFSFTVECPHCGGMFEVSHLAIEVLFTGTDLGVCQKCGLMVTAHLTSRAVDLPNESRQPSLADDGLDDAVIGSLP